MSVSPSSLHRVTPRAKEITGDQAEAISSEKVLETETIFSVRLREILQPLLVLEQRGGWRIFYRDDGQPLQREKDVQILYRLVWFGSPSDAGSEANDGRGPVDFKISKGRHKTLVEIKIAGNSKLKANLKHQAEAYQVASDAERAIKLIVYFSVSELAKVMRILEELGLQDSPDVVLIDARSDNKPSASDIRSAS